MHLYKSDFKKHFPLISFKCCQKLSAPFLISYFVAQLHASHHQANFDISQRVLMMSFIKSKQPSKPDDLKHANVRNTPKKGES